MVGRVEGIKHVLPGGIASVVRFRTAQSEADMARAGEMLKNFGGDAGLKLAQLVRSNTRHFRHMPIGPIGAQLSLQDDRWATAAEAAIGAALNDWVVDNRQDFAVLDVRPVL